MGMAPVQIHTEDVVICPSCATRIDRNERCPAQVGIGICMEKQGHEGWHWTQFTGPGITRWTGLFVKSRACPARLGENTDWCEKPAGHDGAHNNGRGVTFSDPEPEDAHA